MSLPSTWRQFQLFDFLPIRDPKFKSDDPLFSDPTLSAITSTQSYVVFAVQNAYIKILSKDNLTLVKQFCAYDLDYRISYMRPLMHSNILVTLAEKQGSPALIKVLDLTKIMQLDDSAIQSDDTMKHKYVTQVSVHNGDNSFPISCFAFNEFLTCIAIGFANGKVILVRGDMLKDRGSKQRVVYESTDPITGIQFNRMEEVLYLTTTSKIMTLLTTGRNQGKPLRILSNTRGADLDCSDLEVKTSRLIVANQDGLNFYNHVSKAQVVNFNVAKRKILRVFKDYLLVVCPLEDSNSGSSSLTRLLVLDLHNMHISFSLTISNLTISHVFASYSDNTIFLLSTDGILYKLHEKPINQQVEIILQRDLFSIAMSLATQYHLDNGTLWRINRLHGDYLYEKLDFDGAISKYIDCLLLLSGKTKNPNLKPEDLDDFVINVITSFKDISKINNITKFLAKLYELINADSDQVTLLLCCYCKLRMTTELDTFVDELDLERDGTANSSSKLDLSLLNFDLIINLFKESGFYAQVIKLLVKLNRPNLIVELQLNELHQHQQCLDYIKSLPIDELLRILIDYLKDLLKCMPVETTELLINVFTGKYKPDTTFSLIDTEDISKKDLDLDLPQVEKVHMSSYTAFMSYLSGRLGHEVEQDTSETIEEPTYLPPRPSLVFPCFLYHPGEFVIFLEACIETFDKYQGNINDKKVLLMTLFELYLTQSAEHPEEKSDWLAKAGDLLRKHPDLLNKSKVLLISHIYKFKEGEIFATDNLGNFNEGMFRAAQVAGDVQGALLITKRHGDQKPLLFKLMLKFLVSSEVVYKQATPKIFRFLLDKIKENKVCSPLEIIKILSSNDFATVGILKDYLIDFVGETNKDISNNKKLLQSYENESTKNTLMLTELTHNAFVMRNNKCSNCEMRLEFPLIHFKCKHSYHQRCLNENTYIPGVADSKPKCPLCINELQALENLRESQIRTSYDYDVFKMNLDESQDRFKVISDYLGKGVMEDA